MSGRLIWAERDITLSIRENICGLEVVSKSPSPPSFMGATMKILVPVNSENDIVDGSVCVYVGSMSMSMSSHVTLRTSAVKRWKSICQQMG